MKPLRLGRLRLSFNLVADLIRGDVARITKTTAPDDLQVLGVYPADERAGLYLWVICESSTFAEVLEGQLIPEIEPFTYYAEA